jgi:hypothetical protein
MVGFGLLAIVLELGEPPVWPGKVTGVICAAGIGVALYVFMQDAIALAPQGEQAVRNALPKAFPWPVFVVAWLMMLAPLLDMGRQLAVRYK